MRIYMFILITILALILTEYAPAALGKAITETVNHGVVSTCNPGCQSGNGAKQKTACTKCCKDSRKGTNGECKSGSVYMANNFGTRPGPKQCHCSSRIKVKVNTKPVDECNGHCEERNGALDYRNSNCNRCCTQNIGHVKSGICKRSRVVRSRVEIKCHCTTHTPIGNTNRSRNIPTRSISSLRSRNTRGGFW